MNLWYVASSDKCTYVEKYTPTYRDMYDSEGSSSCKLPTCRGMRCITLEHLLVAV